MAENQTKTRVWEDSSLCPEPSTENAVQEFHLWIHILAFSTARQKQSESQVRNGNRPPHTPPLTMNSLLLHWCKQHEDAYNRGRPCYKTVSPLLNTELYEGTVAGKFHGQNLVKDWDSQCCGSGSAGCFWASRIRSRIRLLTPGTEPAPEPSIKK